MAYTNSPLVSYTKLSPNHSGQRTHSIDRITPHCVVGQCSVETLGNIFLPTSRQASSNYGIGVDGRVGMYVEEKNRSWCSSSAANDQRAITIECASDNTEPYAFKDVVYRACVSCPCTAQISVLSADCPLHCHLSCPLRSAREWACQPPQSRGQFSPPPAVASCR